MKIIHEEKNLFTIFYTEDNTTGIGIHNTSKDIKLKFIFNLKRGFNLRTDNDLNPIVWKTVYNLDYEDMLLSVLYEKKVLFYEITYIDEIPQIRVLDDYVNFDYSKPFNLFCGHEGGGTSIVVKMLRYLGLHFGDDCGPITNRKSHESASITAVIKHIDNDTPTYIGRELFNQIWEIYNYKEGQINCVKKPNLKDKTIKLGEIFPNSKIVSIMRTPNGFYSNEEGRKFHEKTEVELLKYQRPLVEGTPVFNLDFYKFFTDHTYVNKLLRFLGSDNFLNNEKEFFELKELINFDERVLKK